MKKLIFIILVMLILPIVSAVEFDMKDEFDQGETLMAKISGTFVEPITEDDVLFYRGHVRIPIDFDFAKINEDFYISASLIGKTQNNYSLVIQDAKYMEAGQVTEADLTKEFLITENLADFSIDPGFLTTNTDYSIQVQNLQDSEITIDIVDGQEETITLRSGEVEDISFNIGNITDPILKTVELSTTDTRYEIPVYILTPEDEIPEQEKEKSFRFEPSYLNISMATSSDTTRIIYLFNDGEATLENLSISISESLDNYAFLADNYIEELEPNSSFKLTLNWTSDQEEKTVEGQITAEHPDLVYAYLTIDLNFIDDYVPIPGEDEIEPVQDPAIKTCEEMGGIICAEGEVCEEGAEEYASDDKCCLKQCLKVEEDTNWKIVGWGIVVIIIIFVYWFFKKRYGGAKRKANVLDRAKGKR